MEQQVISRSVVLTVGMYGLNALLALLTSVVFARLLGPTEFGVFSYYLSLAILIAVPVQAGMPTLLVREMAQAKAGGDWGRVLGFSKKAVESAGAFSLIVIVVGIAVSLTATEPTLLLLAVVLVPLMAFGAIRGAAIRALGRVVIAQVPELVVKPILVLLLAGMWVLLRSQVRAEDALMINVLGAGVAFGVGSAILHGVLHAREPNQTTSPSPQPWSGWLKALAPFTLLAGFHVINRQIGVIVLGQFGVHEDIAIYRVASQFADTLNLLLLAVTAVAGPRVAALYANGDLVELQKVVTRAALEIGALTVPAVALLAIFGDPLIRIVFGDSYVEAFPVLMILAAGQIVSVVAGPVGLVLNMAHRQGWVTAMIGIGALVNLIICAVMGRQYGATAAAGGVAVSVALINITLCLVVKKTLGISTTVLPRRS